MKERRFYCRQNKLTQIVKVNSEKNRESQQQNGCTKEEIGLKGLCQGLLLLRGLINFKLYQIRAIFQLCHWMAISFVNHGVVAVGLRVYSSYTNDS